MAISIFKIIDKELRRVTKEITRKEKIKEIKALYSAYTKLTIGHTRDKIAIGLASKIPDLIAEIEELEDEWKRTLNRNRGLLEELEQPQAIHEKHNKGE